MSEHKSPSFSIDLGALPEVNACVVQARLLTLRKECQEQIVSSEEKTLLYNLANIVTLILFFGFQFLLIFAAASYEHIGPIKNVSIFCGTVTLLGMGLVRTFNFGSKAEAHKLAVMRLKTMRDRLFDIETYDYHTAIEELTRLRKEFNDIDISLFRSNSLSLRRLHYEQSPV